MIHKLSPPCRTVMFLMLNGFLKNLQVSRLSKSSWTPKPPTSLLSPLCRTIPFWQQLRRLEKLLTVVKLMDRRWLFDLVDQRDSLVPSFAYSRPPLSTHPSKEPNVGEDGMMSVIFRDPAADSGRGSLVFLLPLALGSAKHVPSACLRRCRLPSYPRNEIAFISF